MFAGMNNQKPPGNEKKEKPKRKNSDEK